MELLIMSETLLFNLCGRWRRSIVNFRSLVVVLNSVSCGLARVKAFMIQLGVESRGPSHQSSGSVYQSSSQVCSLLFSSLRDRSCISPKLTFVIFLMMTELSRHAFKLLPLKLYATPTTRSGTNCNYSIDKNRRYGRG